MLYSLLFLPAVVVTMSAPKVEQISSPVTLGEGPHWDHDTKCLYYVDIKNSMVFKYNTVTNKHTSAKIDGGPVSIIIPIEGKKDQFVISVGRNIAVMTWDGESGTPDKVHIVATVDKEKGKEDNRINDGKADPKGRLWAGTMGPDTGSAVEFKRNVGALFSFSKDWEVTTHATNITVANGLAWSANLDTMYYIDSITKTVDAFDFDAENERISNRRVIFDLAKNDVEGFPDGMAIDSEGKLWVALYMGSKVIRVDPYSGKLLATVPIPALQVTSVTFGGANFEELYVTSARVHIGEEILRKYPGSGAVFRVTGLNVKGLPGQNVIV